MLKPCFFLVKDEKLLAKYNEAWVKIKETTRRKKFHGHPVFDNKYLKTKIKSYQGRITTNFNSKVPEAGSKWICLSLTVIDSVFKSGKNYLQTFLEDRKYKITEKEK